MLHYIVSFCLVGSAMLLLARGDRCEQACSRKASPVCVVKADGSRRAYASSCVAECYGEDKTNIQNKACSEILCVCPYIYAPVCGSDRQTYASDCNAKCSGVTVAYQGSCNRSRRRKSQCACGRVYSPVCATNGVIYANACQAECEGYQVDPDNGCGIPSQLPATFRVCACPAISDEVCDDNGLVYANECVAQCAGVRATRCSK